MPRFKEKLSRIADDTNIFLKSFFLKKKKYSYLVKPMEYGIFSGGKRFRSAIIVSTGKIFNIDYKKLIAIGANTINTRQIADVAERIIENVEFNKSLSSCFVLFSLYSENTGIKA